MYIGSKPARKGGNLLQEICTWIPRVKTFNEDYTLIFMIAILHIHVIILYHSLRTFWTKCSKSLSQLKGIESVNCVEVIEHRR